MGQNEPLGSSTVRGGLSVVDRGATLPPNPGLAGLVEFGVHGASDVALPSQGQYQLLRRLAVGGMAELFLARSRGIHGFEKTVVIKRILPELAAERRYVAMFLDEAKLTARLNHPSLVQTFDLGMAHGALFLAMEFIDGVNLSDVSRTMRMRGEQFSYEEILAMMMPVGEGLGYAHALADERGTPLGVVHRDVSPSNIVVTPEGTVKVLDFGIAKWSSRLKTTSSGSIKGKYTYLSPEQARAGSIDHRSDVFSFGVVLFELITGRPLFGGHSPAESLRRITQSVIPNPRRWRRDLPRTFEAIVHRALRPNREHRFASMRQMLDELDRMARHESIFVSSRTLPDLMARLYPSPLRRLTAAGTLPPASASHPTDGLLSWSNDLPLPADPDPRTHEATTVCKQLSFDESTTKVTAPPVAATSRVLRCVRAAVLVAVVLAGTVLQPAAHTPDANGAPVRHLSRPDASSSQPSARAEAPIRPRAEPAADRLDRVVVTPLTGPASKRSKPDDASRSTSAADDASPRPSRSPSNANTTDPSWHVDSALPPAP